MNLPLKSPEVIALTVDLDATHAVTGAPLTLLRGQVGAIVAELGQPDASGAYPAFEVEFVDERDGHTYALATVEADQLLPLRERDPAAAVAA